MGGSSRPADLLRDRSGASAVFVGLALTSLIGFAALGTDMGMAYLGRRTAQNAADAAAFTGAAASMAGAPDVVAEARAVAARYGLVDGAGGVSVSVNTPPKSGAYASDPGAVEVVIERPGSRFLSALFTSGGNVIRARAVARAGVSMNACVLALNAVSAASITETGGAAVTLTGCSLFVDSSSSSAFKMSGGATLSADSVGLVGGYTVSGGATLNTAHGVLTGQKPLSDPYTDVATPSYSGCSYNGAALSSGTYSSSAASPTVFCNGLSINAGATVTLNPGVYIIDRGDLQVNGGAILRGTGVTLVLTSSTGSNYATVHINGGASVSLSAPTTGATQGIVFYQDRQAPTNGSDAFNGGANLQLQGALYFPNQTVSFSGGSSTGSDGCTQIVAWEVDFTGGAGVGANCTGVPVRSIGARATALIE